MLYRYVVFGCLLVMVQSKLVQYQVTISSDDKFNPNDKVLVAFYGEQKQTNHLGLQGIYQKFNGHNEATFEVSIAQNIGPITQMKIKRVVNGQKKDWHVSKITVKDPQGKTYEFLCKCVLSKEKGLEVTNTPLNVMKPIASVITSSAATTAPTKGSSAHSSTTGTIGSTQGGEEQKKTTVTSSGPSGITKIGSMPTSGPPSGTRKPIQGGSKKRPTNRVTASQKLGTPTPDTSQPTQGGNATTPSTQGTTPSTQGTTPSTQGTTPSMWSTSEPIETSSASSTITAPTSDTSAATQEMEISPTSQATSSQATGETTSAKDSSTRGKEGSKPTTGPSFPTKNSSINRKTRPSTNPKATAQSASTTQKPTIDRETSPVPSASMKSTTSLPGRNEKQTNPTSGSLGPTAFPLPTSKKTSPTSSTSSTVSEETPSSPLPITTGTGATNILTSNRPGTRPTIKQSTKSQTGKPVTEGPPSTDASQIPGGTTSSPTTRGSTLPSSPSTSATSSVPSGSTVLPSTQPSKGPSTETSSITNKAMSKMPVRSEYKIKITSTDDFNPKDVISIQIQGKNGAQTDFKPLLDIFKKFDGRNEADFNIKAKDVGEIGKISFKRVVKGLKKDWYVHKIVVMDRHERIYEFLCKCTLAKDTGILVTNSPSNIVDIDKKSGNVPSNNIPTVGTELSTPPPPGPGNPAKDPAPRRRFPKWPRINKGVLRDQIYS